jgi:ferric-dicitrate binding protein FerR (iron transport regulator)
VCSFEQGNSGESSHGCEVIIPSQWDGPRHTSAAAAVPPSPASTPAIVAREPSPPEPRRRERPGWVRASLFAAMLLAVTWLMLWLESTAR